VPVLAITLIAGFLLGLGVLFAWRHSIESGNGPPGGSSRVLAVLPFENLGDSTTDYFADGITDAVRGKLSSLPGLQVIASTSSNEYKDSGKPLPVIARELEADYLLIARIRWAKAADGSSRVKVSPELVDVGRGGAPKVKWQQPFDAEITDVFTVQADIADQVANALDLALGTGQKQTLTERPTANLEAYDAFLKGEASGGLAVADAPSLRVAIKYYEQAVALDSTFAVAWAALGRAQGQFYYNVTPTPTAAAAAKSAADRSLALAPGRPDGWLALCEYYQNVLTDYGRSLDACAKGLALTPENSALLTAAALSEQGLGRWDAALRSLEKGRKLDPRSAQTARRLAHTLVRLRRYPEALTAADRGLAASPDNLDLIENKAMAYLAQGDLDGARRVIADAPSSVEPTALVAFFANYWDLFWVLDDDQQRLLLRLPPGVFDGDRGTWGIVRAQTHFVRGDTALARVYADSARLGLDQTLADTPDDPQRRIVRGLALAYMGRKAEAIREGERGLALVPPAGDGYTGPYAEHLLARIYILVGEQEKALDRLEPLLRTPYYLSPGWLRIDPEFDPLRKHPRFRKLVE
jgi:serine/threonine-protein kinase